MMLPPRRKETHFWKDIPAICISGGHDVPWQHAVPYPLPYSLRAYCSLPYACPVKFYPACPVWKYDCIMVQSLPRLPYKEALSYQGKMGTIFHWGAMPSAFSPLLFAFAFSLKRSAPQVPPLAGRSSSLPRGMPLTIPLGRSAPFALTPLARALFLDISEI